MDVPYFPANRNCCAGICKHSRKQTAGQIQLKGQDKSKYPVVAVLHGAQHRKDCQLRLCIGWINAINGCKRQNITKSLTLKG